MNITATRTDLTRFLEIKKAAEQRLTGNASSAAAATPASGTSVASFLDLLTKIKSQSNSPETNASAPVGAAASRPAVKSAAKTVSSQTLQQTNGLLSVYNMNRALKSISDDPAQQEILKSKHLGNLFDAVA